MASRLNPYVFLTDRAAEALAFYRSVFGGEITIRTFGESGMSDTGDAELVMHGELTTPGGFTIMCADTPAGMTFEPGRTMAICLNGEDADELRGWFDALAEGGTVIVPLMPQMWGDEFGQVVDRFGTVWIVTVFTSATA